MAVSIMTHRADRICCLALYREGFQVALVVKNRPANAGDTRDVVSITGWRRSPAVGNGDPLQYSCLEKFHGQRSLAGYGPRGHKELDVTEHTFTDKNFCPPSSHECEYIMDI